MPLELLMIRSRYLALRRLVLFFMITAAHDFTEQFSAACMRTILWLSLPNQANGESHQSLHCL